MGIGTSTPESILELKDENPALYLNDNDEGDVEVALRVNNEDFEIVEIEDESSSPQSSLGGNAWLTIDNDGNVGIGKTSPSYTLYVNGTAYASGAAGALSDYRHKMNIRDLSLDACEIVNHLRPVTFEWKEPRDSGMEGIQLGFIAQEVEEVLPEVVLTEYDEAQTKGLKYNALIPVLIRAIQELIRENAELKKMISCPGSDPGI